MIEKKRKSTACKNCSSSLDENYNFCPTCGQSNSDNNVTFATLVKEFVDNYLGIDSKMAHSAVPFLIRPGNLTNRFQEGKVKHFIHPVRLYFVMSLFYFFTISYLLSGIDLRSIQDDDQINFGGDMNIEKLKSNDEWNALPDSVKLNVLSDSMVSKFTGIKTFDQLYDSIQSQIGADSLKSLEVNVKSTSLPFAKEGDLERYHRLARDRSLTDKVFMDSIINEGNIFGGDLL